MALDATFCSLHHRMYKGAALMITFIIIIIAIAIMIYFPIVPFTVTHFYQIVYNGVIDLYKYIKHKERNRCKAYGRIYMITAFRNKVFGSGKTLDMTMLARRIYNRYDGLPVWN